VPASPASAQAPTAPASTAGPAATPSAPAATPTPRPAATPAPRSAKELDAGSLVGTVIKGRLRAWGQAIANFFRRLFGRRRPSG